MANSQGEPLRGYTNVQVFSATMAKDRAHLGVAISDWIASAKPEIVDTVVTQSSDHEFHCLTITVFYNRK